MGKKRGRRGNTDRAVREKLAIRRGKRHHFIVISVLTALASLALLVAGFLNFSAPAGAPAASPTIQAPAAPQGAVRPPLAIVDTLQR